MRTREENLRHLQRFPEVDRLHLTAVSGLTGFTRLAPVVRGEYEARGAVSSFESMNIVAERIKVR